MDYLVRHANVITNKVMLLRIFPICSPLFSILKALVNASIVDGDMDLVKDAILYLLCIFRAIKRAEDAVDAQKTPVSIVFPQMSFSLMIFCFILCLIVRFLYNAEFARSSGHWNLHCE